MSTAPSLLLLLLLAPVVRGQIPAAPAASDSGPRERIMLQDPGIALGRPTFFIPRRFAIDLNFSLPSYGDGSDPRLVGASPFPFRPDPKHDLIAPLRLQWDRDAELRAVRKILGSVSFGVAGFLAVRSLRKSDSKPPLPPQIRTNKP